MRTAANGDIQGGKRPIFCRIKTVSGVFLAPTRADFAGKAIEKNGGGEYITEISLNAVNF